MREMRPMGLMREIILMTLMGRMAPISPISSIGPISLIFPVLSHPLFHH